MEYEDINPLEIANKVYDDRRKEATEWYNESVNLIDEATNEKKAEILKDVKEEYDNAKELVLQRILKQFSQLMKEHGNEITQYGTKNKDTAALFDFLIENANDKQKSKVTRTTSSQKISAFEEDNALIMKYLEDCGQDVTNLTVWAEGTLLHKHKFFSPNDKIKIRTRLHEYQEMKILLITKTQMLTELNGVRLILTPEDISSGNYVILG